MGVRKQAIQLKSPLAFFAELFEHPRLWEELFLTFLLAAVRLEPLVSN